MPGVHSGDLTSYVKWVEDPGTTDFPQFSLCMRCIMEFGLLYKKRTCQPRFNPSRIDRTEMTLAAVMNGKGNGNKDEVVQRIKHTLYVILYY